jgi:glycosyltransferase involved in cell wall biosynthesis
VNILLVGDYANDPRLGSAKVMHKLRDEFGALGHKCDVLFAEDLGGPRSRQVRQAVAPLYAYAAVRRRLRAQPYDIVDAASAEGLWVGAARRAGAYPSTAFVCRSHGLEHLNYERMLEDARAGLVRKGWTRRVWYPASRLSQVALAAKLADALIVLNDSDRQFAVTNRWQRPDRVFVVPHGVSETLLRDVPSVDRSRTAGLLFCGSWDHVKGIAYLVDAFVALARSGRIVPLTILGPGVAAEVVMSAFPEEVRPMVTVTPRGAEQDVIDAYRRHALLVFPSSYEGFGLVLLEALSQGLPVVATGTGAAPMLVRDGENGMLVPPRDSDAMFRAIAAVLDDPDLRQRMAQAASRQVRNYTWRTTALQTLDVYERARHTAARTAA